MRFAPYNTYPYLVFRLRNVSSTATAAYCANHLPQTEIYHFLFRHFACKLLPLYTPALFSLTHPVTFGHLGVYSCKAYSSPVPSTSVARIGSSIPLPLSILLHAFQTSPPRFNTTSLDTTRQQLSALFYMSDLRDRLSRLGLAQYSDVFATEGFDTWETVLDITESDL